MSRDNAYYQFYKNAPMNLDISCCLLRVVNKNDGEFMDEGTSLIQWPLPFTDDQSITFDVSQLPNKMIFLLYTGTSALIIQLAVATLYSRVQIVSDLAVDTIGRFCPFFLQNVSFIYVTKPQNLSGVVWRRFTPQKQPGKLTLGVFQDLLSNSVNFESLFYY